MSISDQELRERLLALGYNPPPITSTSRGILLKKLKALETGSSMQPENDVDSSSEEKDSLDLPNTDKPSKRKKFVPVISRQKKEKRDFWDRIGLLGNTMFVIGGTFVMFFIFQFIGDWSDRRYRTLISNDMSLPICKDLETTNCIPKSTVKFTELNLNAFRASLHHIIMTHYCKKNDKSPQMIGMYPAVDQNEMYEVLTKEVEFSDQDANTLIQNSKIVFKENPKWDIKVQGDKFIYKNHRMLRSCGFMPWGEYAYTYALYAFASFVVVWLTYSLNSWVTRSRSDNVENLERALNNLVGILKQGKEEDFHFITVHQAREWLITPEDEVRNPRLWSQILKAVSDGKIDVTIKTKSVDGATNDFFCLK